MIRVPWHLVPGPRIMLAITLLLNINGGVIMVKEFYDLEVWRRSRCLVRAIYTITLKFPDDEIHGLISQLKKASNSICANIAEGFSRYHVKDKSRFYHIARGSASECISHLFVARDQQFLSEENADRLIAEFNNVCKMLNGMVRNLGARD